MFTGHQRALSPRRVDAAGLSTIRSGHAPAVVLLLPAERVIVTAAPGTGSTSLLTHLGRVRSSFPVPEDDVVASDGSTVDAKHAPVGVVVRAGLLDPDTIGGWRIVTSTRNPFDFWAAEWHRTRTRWRDLLDEPGSWVHRQPDMLRRIDAAVTLSFVDWVHHALDAQRRVHLNPGHVEEATHVLRMEHLDDDLAAACPELAPLGPVPHTNATSGRPHYGELYDTATRDLVTTVHQSDIERFGYTF